MNISDKLIGKREVTKTDSSLLDLGLPLAGGCPNPASGDHANPSITLARGDR